jgi:6-phosphogluconolactonase (cycloisomerase 2 family)
LEHFPIAALAVTFLRGDHQARIVLNRRHFAGLLAALPVSRALARDSLVPFYNCVGPELFIHSLDAVAAKLTLLRSVTLPANVQYAWPHPSGRFLYVASSDGTPGGSSGPGAPGARHHVTSFQVAASGLLTPHNVSLALSARPIHLSVDRDGRFLLIAYNAPSSITVHRIGPDGSLGPEIAQPQGLDFGIYAHQVRVTPSGRGVMLVTRGNDAVAGKSEDPGAIKVFRFRNGRLDNLASIAPGNGLGFGPRHLDFHPALPIVAVSLERQNMLHVYGMTRDDNLTSNPLFRLITLRDPLGKKHHPGQGAGPIHVHPRGHVVYVANRGSGTIEFEGERISNGGENSIAVFALDRRTGAPRRLQNIDTDGFETRTFTIDPTGTLLVAASQSSLNVRDGSIRKLSAGLSFFRIRADGQLNFLYKQDVDTSKGTQFWCGTLWMS